MWGICIKLAQRRGRNDAPRLADVTTAAMRVLLWVGTVCLIQLARARASPAEAQKVMMHAEELLQDATEVLHLLCTPLWSPGVHALLSISPHVHVPWTAAHLTPVVLPWRIPMTPSSDHRSAEAESFNAA